MNAVKRIEGVRTYVSVDGGMADNPRVALYQAEYEAALANRMAVGGHDGLDSLENPANPASPANPATSEGWDTVSVAGNCCESGDMLVWDIAMPRPEVGDTLAVFCTGAYNYSMASNYNRYPRPAVVLVHDGRADVIVEREAYTDLVAHDLVPARLRPASARPAAAGSAHLDSAGAQSR